MASVLKGLLVPVLFVGLLAGACSSDKAQDAHADHADHEMGSQEAKTTADDQPAIDAVTGYVDPVCSMKIPTDAPVRMTHEGVTYGFCSAACKDMFAAAPQNYLAAIEE